MISEARRTRLISTACVITTALLLLCIAPQTQAVPAFARQMGVPCSTCHFQHFPLLNSFGRIFKASGFTMAGTPLTESDGFSLPVNLNAAIFTNLRFQKSNGTKNPAEHTSNNGEFILPGETSLFVGGRVSPNVGALIEGDVGAGGINGGGFLASIKLPMFFDVTDNVSAGIVPFSAGLGPSYAFEMLNTGAVGNHIINLVHPTAISAQQYVQVGTNSNTEGDAEGVALVAVSSDFFVTGALWSPNHSVVDSSGTSASPKSDYFRAAVTPQIGSWDVGMGVQLYDGRSNVVTGPGAWTRYSTRAWAVDGQLQGGIASMHDMPVGVYVSYAQAPASTASEPNLYNAGSETKKSASVAAEFGLFKQGRGTVQLAYRWGRSGDPQYSNDNAATAGLTYLPWDNVQFAMYETWFSGNAHSDAASGLGAIDASGSGKSLLSLNMAVGF